MKVKLVGITQPTEEWKLASGGEDAEDLIAYCARVSNPENQENFATSRKLLGFCMRKKHWSIFEMVHLVLEIQTTRDIGRQILRHRSFQFQEFSQRYAKINTNDFVLREARRQDEKNRQNSLEIDDQILKDEWEYRQLAVIREVTKAYQWALDSGIAKEQARAVLPEGMTPSTMYMGGVLRDWMFYCTLRMGDETQKEHRHVAEACWNVVRSKFEFLPERLYV